jgi:hypothetical protein
LDQAQLARLVLLTLRESPRNLTALVNDMGQTYKGVTMTAIRRILERQANEKLVRCKAELYGLTKRGLTRAQYYTSEGFTL